MARSQHYTYVESEDSFPSEFICTVCHDVAGTHTACPGCSQTCCQSCVHRWFNTQKSNIQGCTCPYCRRKLKFSDLKHDPTIQQKLDELRVYCPNQSAGCTEQLPRGAVAAHLSTECDHQECSCQHCGLRGLRAAVRVHQERFCPNRPVPCANAAVGCTYEVPMHVMPPHLDLVCDLQPRPCPQCSQAVPRKDWSMHLQTACPAKQYCPLRLYGCSYSGTATDVQQHGQSCSYLAHQQQLQQQIEGARFIGNIIAASLSSIDPGELASSSLLDEYCMFGAQTLHTASAATSKRVLDAVPVAALPCRVQPQQDWLARVSEHTAQERSASLAAQTPPTCAAATASGDTSSSSCTMKLSNGMSPAEALALGLPGCFELVGLASNPNLETAWRIALNLVAIDVLSSEGDDMELPSTFLLYTSMCRAWNAVHGRYGQLEGTVGQQQQQQQDSEGNEQQTGNPATSSGVHQQQAGLQVQQPGSSNRSNGASSSSSNSGGQNGHQNVIEAELGEPGLERGLNEDEYEQLNSWIVHQHDTMAAVAAAVGCVLQLWLQPGLAVLLPEHVTELQQLVECASEASTIMAEIAKPKKRGSSSRHNSGAGTSAQQQQQWDGGGSAGVGPLEGGVRAGTSTAVAAAAGTGAPQQRQTAEPAAATPSRAARTPSRTALNRNSSTSSNPWRQLQDKHESAAAAAAGSSSSHSPVSFSAALQQLDQLAAMPHSRQVLQRGILAADNKLHALELYTSILLLHHLRAEHVETSMIPHMPDLLLTGFRGYWGVSILAAAEAQLGSRFRLGWQALAVLNDMVSGLVGRILQVTGEGFYDAAEGRVPLNPQLAMAVIQLLVPPGIVLSCLERLSVLSSRFHDEECEDLTEVTWQQLAARIGLKIELDKLVYLVDERLPVTLEEDEDEEMDDGSTDSRSRSGSDGEEYTTDDEDLPQLPATVTAANNRRAAAAESDDDSEAGWESADSDEVMELLGPQHQDGHQQQQQPSSPAAEELAGTSSAASGEVAAAMPAATADPASPSPRSPDSPGQQQTTSKSPGSSSATAAAAAGGAINWQQEFRSNLMQLAATSSDLSPLERELLHSQVHEMDWLGSEVADAFTPASHDTASAENVEGGPELFPAQQVQPDGGASGRASIVNGQAAVAGAAVGGTAAHTAFGPQQQQQQQQDREAKEKEAGDACTHGVVLFAGLVEHVLTQLLIGALKAAAQQATGTAAAAAAGVLNDVQAGPPIDSMEQSSNGAGQQQQPNSSCVHTSARHVLLAATESEDLRALIIDRPVDQQHHNPAAVAWAGVSPHFSKSLLPDPDEEPITAWLLDLAAGKQQQQQQQHLQDSSSSDNDMVAYPADLRFYCGRGWIATPEQPGAGGSTDVDSTYNGTVGQNPSSSVLNAVVAVEAGVTCCYLSGWQCGRCAAATAALATRSLANQLSMACDGLERLNNRGGAASSSSGAAVLLHNDQLQLLKDMTRMYHLQQPWWYETASSRDDGSSSCGPSSSGEGIRGSASAAVHRQMLSTTDRLQLAVIHDLLKPLRDVIAIREIFQQQQREGLVWPTHDFDVMVEEAIEAVALQKQQQSSLQKRMQQLVVKPAAAAAAVAAAGDEETLDDPEVADMVVEEEALTLLATAAEDFLIQHFRSANELALHAGRQELTPEDVRLALVSNGHRHMLPREGQGRTDGSGVSDIGQLFGL